MKKKKKIDLLIVLMAFCTIVFLTSCGQSPADQILGSVNKLIFIKENSVNRNGMGKNAMQSNVNEFFPGSDLYALTPIASNGDLINLTAQYTRSGEDNPDYYGAVADPEVSYDGTKILFAMKKSRYNYRWHIYEIDEDGSNLVQLTDDSLFDAMDPAYLPDGRIVFTSTRTQIVDEYESRPSPLLYIGERDPQNSKGLLIKVRQISFNQSHETNPIVHSSGKIYFSRWEHLGNPNKFAIFTVDPDGTDLFILFGNHSPTQSGSRVYMEFRELSDGGLITSLMERNSPAEGGALAILNIASSDDSISWVVPEGKNNVPFNNTDQTTEALLKCPYPVMDGNKERILFSMSPKTVLGENDNGTADYGIYIMDKNGKNVELVYDDPMTNELDPIVVAVHAKPNVLPSDPNVTSGIANGDSTGLFFDANVYDRGDDGLPKPKTNEVKYLRILEAVARPVNGSLRGAEIGDLTEREKERVVGYGPVGADGSFCVKVPANRSLHMQTLDENGMAIVNQRTWVQVMPGEHRRCTGCHGSHQNDQQIKNLIEQSDGSVINNTTAIPKTYDYGFHNAYAVANHPLAHRDTVDFYDRYQPNKLTTVYAIFKNRCHLCHGFITADTLGGKLVLEHDPADSLDGLSSTTQLYQKLTEGSFVKFSGTMRDTIRSVYVALNGDSINYVSGNNEGSARNSPLIWVLFNQQLGTSSTALYKTTSYDHAGIWERDSLNKVNPFLTSNKDLLRIIEWIDGGGQYSNSVFDTKMGQM